MFWVRVTGVSTFLLGLTVIALFSVFPAPRFPWAKLASGVVMAPGLVALLMCIPVLHPLHVEVRRDRIRFMHGSTATRILAESLRSIAFEEREDGMLRLRVDYVTRRGIHGSRTFVVSPSVDRAALEVAVRRLAETASHASLRDISLQGTNPGRSSLRDRSTK